MNTNANTQMLIICNIMYMYASTISFQHCHKCMNLLSLHILHYLHIRALRDIHVHVSIQQLQLSYHRDSDLTAFDQLLTKDQNPSSKSVTCRFYPNHHTTMPSTQCYMYMYV